MTTSRTKRPAPRGRAARGAPGCGAGGAAGFGCACGPPGAGAFGAAGSGDRSRILIEACVTFLNSGVQFGLDIGFDSFQSGGHLSDLLLPETCQSLTQHRLAEGSELFQGGRRFLRQIKAIRASVRIVVAALDQPARAQLVDQARQRDRRQVERLGELALLEALAALKAR